MYDEVLDSRTSASKPRGSFRLMFDPSFGVVFWAKFVILTATWAVTLVTVIMAYQLTGSAAWAGATGAALMIPQFGLSLLSGRMSDRYGPLRQIVAGSLISGVACLGLSSWFAFSDVGPAVNATALLVSSLAFGVGLALSAPAMQSIVPMLVSADELPAAVGLNFVPTTLARTIGPALGALAISTLGPTYTLLIFGSSMLLIVPCFRLVRRHLVMGFGQAKDSRIRGVLRFVWSDKPLLACLGGVAAIGAGSEAAVTLSPVIASSLGEPGAGGGVITGAFGLGGLIGVIVHRLMQKRGTPSIHGCLSMLVLATTLPLAACGGSLPVVAGLFAIGGAGMVAGITAFSIAIQLRCPPEMLGRVMAVWTLAFAGFRPIAAIALGFTADHFSTAAALLGAGLFTLVAACWIWISLRQSDVVPPCQVTTTFG
ncbi:putative MFS family arabinose efflux permease [Paenarthrobacter nicotinovorans]|uniref:MFS transporter n=1 Tax=Micrococcaceae TaxID=1268 RepID=UPI0008770C4A|nr:MULTISPECIES: MFS transporter [Micrococcaceae]MDR6438676.1 putative MFS family arabinose efflux permease [Paenarthrobacter nicotinovorans]SCZ56577.1 Predicted arabinose efflux permease, MFS family [Arthrobacter sp. UNCCL28]